MENNYLFDLLPYQVYEYFDFDDQSEPAFKLTCAFINRELAEKWIAQHQTNIKKYRLSNCHMVNGRLVDDLQNKKEEDSSID